MYPDCLANYQIESIRPQHNYRLAQPSWALRSKCSKTARKPLRKYDSPDIILQIFTRSEATEESEDHS